MLQELLRIDVLVTMLLGVVVICVIQWTAIVWMKMQGPRVHAGNGSPEEEKKHLFVVVHGFSGNPGQMRFLCQRLMQEEGVLAVPARCNWGPIYGFFATGDGIDQGGRRLAQEVREVVALYPSLKTISIFGDGVGGLYARYACGLLYDRNKEVICGLQPLNFVTLATPHLGVRSVVGRWSKFAARYLVGASGRQLLLEDVSNFPEPLLVRMSEEGSVFMLALNHFRHKSFYSDVGSLVDGLYCSGFGCVRQPKDADVLRRTSLGSIDADVFPHVVSVHHDTSSWTNNDDFVMRYGRSDHEYRIARNLEHVSVLRVAVYFRYPWARRLRHSYRRWDASGRDVVEHMIANLSGRRPIRVWTDGCFDMMHFGHANAFRQARAMGDVLVVGLNPDSEIVKHKGGPPIMSDEERLIAVDACKWVDEVIPNVPYALDEEWLARLFDKYQIDYIVHGDDPCFTATGEDVYAMPKRLGRFKTVKRTEGVSTTDLVGRMLLLTKDHHTRNADDRSRRASDCSVEDEVPARSSTFLATTRRITQFSNNRQAKSTDKVVYVDGAFDLFHAGHISFLKKAKALGDFLYVGIHRDDEINQHRGANFPIMNLHERTLGVLSCKYVDEVIMGAPWEVTKDMIVTLNLSVVVCGEGRRHCGDADVSSCPLYRLPAEMGILKELSFDNKLTTSAVVERIIRNRDTFEVKFEKKDKQEAKYHSEKTYMEEK